MTNPKSWKFRNIMNQKKEPKSWVICAVNLCTTHFGWYFFCCPYGESVWLNRKFRKLDLEFLKLCFCCRKKTRSMTRTFEQDQCLGTGVIYRAFLTKTYRCSYYFHLIQLHCCWKKSCTTWHIYIYMYVRPCKQSDQLPTPNRCRISCINSIHFVFHFEPCM